MNTPRVACAPWGAPTNVRAANVAVGIALGLDVTTSSPRRSRRISPPRPASPGAPRCLGRRLQAPVSIFTSNRSTSCSRNAGGCLRTRPASTLPNLALLDQGGSAALRRARHRSWRAAALGGRPTAAARTRMRPTDQIGSPADLTVRQAPIFLGFVSVPVAVTRSRAPTASHAIASRPLTW